MEHIVIVGGGQASLSAAEALRAAGWNGTLHWLGDEPHAPYHRPPLSKGWLAGTMQREQLTLRAPQALARKGIELHTHTAVAALDRQRQRVELADGRTLPYDGLVLATGARVRLLALPGANAQGVFALRTLADAQNLAQALDACHRAGQPVVVIGGGFIGLEVAATARKKGLEVTVLEAAPRLLGRVLAPALSAWFAQLHQRHGVQVLLDARPDGLEVTPQGQVCGVHLADGRQLPAGLVVLGVGVQANDELARAAGLVCDRGIVVDACARSSDPTITAAGDCTARRLPGGGLLRLESVQNATEQGKSAAAALLGQERPFTATPWFWSDQYDQKLQIAGLSQGADHWVLRGDMQAGTGFSLFHYAGAQLLAVDSVNAPKDHLLARKLLDAGRSPSPQQAADLGFDLNDLLS